MKRNKEKNWNQAYERALWRLSTFVKGWPRHVVVSEAQLLIEAHYGGPWKMMCALLKRELRSICERYCGQQWEVFRVKVLRRPKSEFLIAYERDEELARANLMKAINEREEDNQ